MKKILIVLSLMMIFIYGCSTSETVEIPSPTIQPVALETAAPTEFTLLENSTFAADQNADIQTHETQEEISEETYIGNKNSKKFHIPSCNTLPAEKNRIYFSSRDKAVDSGFSPCSNCHP